MGYFKCSNGDKVSKANIDKYVRTAKQEKVQAQYAEYGFNFCEGDEPEHESILDCAHIESVDSCQKNGHAEKAWDIENIKILCRSCHRLHDKTNLKSAKL